MKKLYGVTPLKYLGDSRPVLGLETGNVGLFAPLHQTRYKSFNGWKRSYMRHRRKPEDQFKLTIKNFHKTGDQSDFLSEAGSYIAKNEKLNQTLNIIESRMKRKRHSEFSSQKSGLGLNNNTAMRTFDFRNQTETQNSPDADRMSASNLSLKQTFMSKRTH